jgi:alpha-L-fucosidase
MIAHYYNADRARVGSRPQVVYNCKQQSEGRWVDDLERGVMPGILPNPWQCDTSIGDWYYNADWQYRGIAWTIHILLDIVSKNGNLLLNVVQRPDGSLDPEVEALLEQMAAWMAANGEGVYGTRPWVTFGEGAVRAKGGHFGEDYAYSASDIRFTWKRGTLFAFAMGRPSDGKLLIRSLATKAGPGRVRRVTVLGCKEAVQWSQGEDGLTVALPSGPLSEVAIGLKITGTGLRDFTPPEPDAPIADAGPDGTFALRLDDAVMHGTLRVENRGGRSNIGFWDASGDSVTWKLRVPAAGTYEVMFAAATPHAGSSIIVEIGKAKVGADIPATGGWDTFAPVAAGKLRVPEAGIVTLRIRPRDPISWKAINLTDVKLTRS